MRKARRDIKSFSVYVVFEAVRVLPFSELLIFYSSGEKR